MGENGLTTDATYYLRLAENILAGEGFRISGLEHTTFPPGYPLIISLFNTLFEDTLFSGQIISLISFIVSSLLVYVLILKITNNYVISGMFSSFFLLNPDILSYSTKIETYILYIALLLTNVMIMYNILDGRSGKIKYCLLGVINGIMYLIRPEGIIIFFINIFLLSYYVIKNKKKFSNVLFLVASFSILASFYINFLHTATGKWILSGKAANLMMFETVTNKEPYLWEKTGYQLVYKQFPMLMAAAHSNINTLEYINNNRTKLFKRVKLNLIRYSKTLILNF